jgi:ABC-type Fe3+/spermidine/putrescine transport system ATPase subunit
MLELENLSVRAGDFRLRDVCLTVAAGESHVILGPSGSGKTTLLEAVLGLRAIEAGSLRLAGRDLAAVPMERRGIGYLPQRLALFPHLSVWENIAYGARARRLAEADFRPLAEALVAATGIGALLERRPGTLSGGERQRVALVRALAAKPRLLLLDEPFSALNETLRRELWWLLKRLQAEHGFTTLMITHDLAEAFFLGERISVLIDGRIRQSAAKDTVWHRPATVEVANYLGIHNLFAGTVTETGAGTATIDCPVLGQRLTLPLPADGPTLTPGQAVTLGIRPELVALRDGAHPPRADELTLAGRIAAVSLTGEEATLLFQPDGAKLEVEIRVGRRVLRKFAVAAGEEGQIGLPHKDLFLIS